MTRFIRHLHRFLNHFGYDKQYAILYNILFVICVQQASLSLTGKLFFDTCCQKFSINQVILYSYTGNFRRMEMAVLVSI